MTAKTDEKSQVTYNRAVKTARSASGKMDAASWIIGDAALTVATEYGENTLKRFADDIRKELATVRGFRTMAARYPAPKDPENLQPGEIARDLQHATVYGIFASQDDAHKLVNRKDDNDQIIPWTVTEARELVKSRKTSDETEIERTERHIKQLESQLANAKVKLAALKAAEVKPAEVTPLAEVTAPEVTAPAMHKRNGLRAA